jgi:hypothetical protein
LSLPQSQRSKPSKVAPTPTKAAKSKGGMFEPVSSSASKDEAAEATLSEEVHILFHSHFI